MEVVMLELTHSGAGKQTIIEFTLPVFDLNVIHWRNSKKALMFVGDVLVDSEFDVSMHIKEENKRMDLHITCPNDTAIQAISSAIADALRNWFYEKEESYEPLSVQIAIDRWFANGDEWRVLKYSKIAQEDQHNGIIIRNPISTNSHIERMMSKIFNPDLWNIIDVNSTSFSDKANESFRFVNGVSVSDGVLVPAPTRAGFCDILDKHAIGLGMNPKRVYLLRNTFEQVVDLVSPEEPWVSPYAANETNMLHGLNLVTAVMHLKHYTHEDGIAISQSAADRMTAGRIITQLIESDMPVRPLVKVGDSVDGSSVIALDGDKQVTANKLHVPSVIEEINVSKGKRFGVETNRCWIKFRSFYPLSAGDKLSNRHGGKGVVTVVPDADMPWCPDTGDKIEVCIGPESIINRRSMSVFWEMMLCNKVWFESFRGQRKATPIRVKLYEENEDNIQWPQDDNHNFALLATQFSQKHDLALGNDKLPEPTFIGKMFWMRLDKIAMEIASSVGKKRKKNSFGAVIDSAKSSGQRCNAAKLLALAGRDMETLAAELIDQNMSGQKFFKQLVDAARNERFVKK